MEIKPCDKSSMGLSVLKKQHVNYKYVNKISLPPGKFGALKKGFFTNQFMP